MMKVLFLDFDGVLHALGESAFDENFKWIHNPNLFQWIPILDRILEPYPDVRIIVSSDWRCLLDDENLKHVLGPLGPRFEGVVEGRVFSRAEEIRSEVKRRKIHHWLAIDDHQTVAQAGRSDDHFVVCNSSKGLSQHSTQEELKRKLSNWSVL